MNRRPRPIGLQILSQTKLVEVIIAKSIKQVIGQPITKG